MSHVLVIELASGLWVDIPKVRYSEGSLTLTLSLTLSLTLPTLLGLTLSTLLTLLTLKWDIVLSWTDGQIFIVIIVNTYMLNDSLT